MAIVRSFVNQNQVTDFTDEINEIPLQYGYLSSSNLFNLKPVAATSVTFDKIQNSISLLPNMSRSGHEKVYGKDDIVTPFALPLSFHSMADKITAQDIQDYRMPGTDLAETIANVRVEKLANIRRSFDMTREFMLLSAIKGVCTTPDGTVIADMFSEFGLSGIKTIDWDLVSNSSLAVDTAVANLKRYIATNVKTGGAIGGVTVLCSGTFFDALLAHPVFREAYKYFNDPQMNPLRGDTSSYMNFGIMDMFVWHGVRFLSYDPVFTYNGTSTAGIADLTAYAFATGVPDLFRGHYGPSNKLSTANQPGQPFFAYEYASQNDEFIELQGEMSLLAYCTKPASLVKLTAS